jgi:endonuclease YncB( thermonuclease family)
VLRRIPTSILVLAALASVTTVLATARADTWARVFLNGVPVPVYFNDGDSFRIMGGPLQGSPCRLAGFNTLESHGPVHQWGDWHPYELFVNAKRATYNGRRGTWHCTTDGERDTYGRLLTHCPDLAVDQIRRGYAHAMQVDDTPSPPEYLRAQQEAIRARRGMWAHGVPDFVMTSLHSMSEYTDGRPTAYNRRVSTLDGHSESNQHSDSYGECQWVCDMETSTDTERGRAAARRLREDPSIAPGLSGLYNLNLEALVSRFVRTGELPASVPEGSHAGVLARLTQERDQGLLGETREVLGSCGLYVEFERRYGNDRAVCLRGRGTWDSVGRAVRAGAH